MLDDNLSFHSFVLTAERIEEISSVVKCDVDVKRSARGSGRVMLMWETQRALKNDWNVDS